MLLPYFCIQPMDDELINSFIFRILLFNSCQNFTGIIHNEGWRVNPFMPCGYEYLLRDIHISKLVYLYENAHEYDYLFDYMRLNLTSKESFSKPFTLYQTFFSRKKDGKHDKQISLVKYCPECIKEQIKNKGFSYFKVEWSNSNYCEKHGCDIYTIDNKRDKFLFQELSNILSGNFTKSKQIITAHKSNITNKVKDFTFRVAPCARLIITFYAVKHNKIKPGLSYYQGIDSLNNEEFQFFYNYLIAHYCFHSLSDCYDQLMVSDFKNFFHYLNDLCEIVEAEYKINSVPIPNKFLLKAKQKLCSDCTTYTCPNNSKYSLKYSQEITHCLSCSLPLDLNFYKNIDSFSICKKCSKFYQKLQLKLER